FDDTVDHFENAVLRLMISRELFQPWLDASGRQSGALTERLAAGWRALKPEWAPSSSEPRYPRIAENPAFGVRLEDGGALGRLVRRDGTVETEPPPYEEGYFEGGEARGYGHYLK